MNKFYLTFGVQYSRETHPQGDHVHPDGYVVITAKDYDIARLIVTQLYGNRWSSLYRADQFTLQDKALYPKGVLLNIQVPERHDVD